MKRNFFLRERFLERGIRVAHVRQIRFRERDDFLSLRERGRKFLQLRAQREIVLHRIATFARIDRDEMKQRARALDVLQN